MAADPVYPRHHRAWMVAYAVLAVALIVRAGVRDRGVIIDHIEFGRRLLEGLDVYAGFHIPGRRSPGPLHPPYPPSFGLLAAPFSLVGETVARFAWATVQMVALGGILAALMRWVRREVPAMLPRFHPVFFAALLLTGRYLLRDTHGGGGNLINAGLCLGGAALALAGRAGIGGVLVGLSLATKPNQVLLLPLLWLLGQRRATLVAAATVIGAVAVSIVLRGGTEDWRQWIDGVLAYGAMVDPWAEPRGGFPPFTWMNQCLRCALYRFLATTPDPWAAEIPGFRQGLGLPLTTVAWIARAANALLLAATFAVAWRVRHRGRELLVPMVATFFTLSLLLSPITWKAHHVALLPAFTVLLATGGRATWIVLALYFPSCAIGEEIIGKELKNVLQSWYVVTAWDLVILTMLWWKNGVRPHFFTSRGR